MVTAQYRSALFNNTHFPPPPFSYPLFLSQVTFYCSKCRSHLWSVSLGQPSFLPGVHSKTEIRQDMLQRVLQVIFYQKEQRSFWKLLLLLLFFLLLSHTQRKKKKKKWLRNQAFKMLIYLIPLASRSELRFVLPQWQGEVKMCITRHIKVTNGASKLWK